MSVTRFILLSTKISMKTNNNIENNDILEDPFPELFEIDPPLINESSFSLFDPPVFNTKPKESVTLFQTNEMIKSSLFAGITEAVKKDLDLKTKILPFVTFSGNFRTRSSNEIISYSQLIVIDLDHLPSAHSTKELLIKDSFLQPALAFISPSQKGLKLVIKIEEGMPEEHELYFNAISAWLLQTYNLKIDKSGKDLARICFLAFDPACRYSATGSVNRNDLLNLLPALIPIQHPLNGYEVKRTLPPAPQKPSEILNGKIEIYERAVSALLFSGWKQKDEYWYRPGRQLNEHHAAIMNKDPKSGLFIFTNYSTQAFPFLCKGYSLVQIICELNFGGDWSACIKELSEQYLPPRNKAFKLSDGSLHLPETGTESENSQNSYFQCRSFDQIVSDGLKANKRRKIGGAFLYENSTTYLFSRTNVGKSLFVFQFAHSAATGTGIDNCEALLNECEPMKVLVVDLELEARDLAERHGTAIKNMKPEHLKNLMYLHEKIENNVVVGFDLLNKIEQEAISHGAKLVIIDNISKLLPDALKPETVTMVISSLNRIRKITGASILVIGHTTKGNPKIAIQPTDYFGSSMVQNFFSEISFIDRTKDGKFFLCHAKTKYKECYDQVVPVFTRDHHPVVGVGFAFESMQLVSDIQLPLAFNADKPSRRSNMAKFKKEISILDAAGVNRTTIAEMCNVARSTIYRVFET